MTSAPIEELSVAYDPGPTQEKVARRRSMVRSRLLTLGITVVIMIVIYIWRRDQFAGTAGVFLVYGLVLAVSLAWLAVVVVLYLRSKRELTTIGTGIAVRIDRRGISIVGSEVPWPEVATVGAISGKFGESPLLQVTRTSGEALAVPFHHLDVLPATLDSHARAFSGGRHGVDLAALDN